MDGNRELGPLQYFIAECFEESAALASQFGISYKRSRRLVRGAVSTVFLSAAAVATAEVTDYESAPTSTSRKRPAADYESAPTSTSRKRPAADYKSAPTSTSHKRPAVAESSSRKRTAAEFPKTATNKRSAVEKRERARVMANINN